MSVLFHVAPQSTVDATFKKAVPYIFITRGLNPPRHLLVFRKGYCFAEQAIVFALWGKRDKLLVFLRLKAEWHRLVAVKSWVL
ncbi:hypothetical protein AAG906_005284 [Vitis piasezkii]